MNLEANQELAQDYLLCWTQAIVSNRMLVSDAALTFGDSLDPTPVGV
jgi:hypothetical protein